MGDSARTIEEKQQQLDEWLAALEAIQQADESSGYPLRSA